MMDKENKKLISGFLSNKLSKEEKIRFLQKISTNKAFLKELLREIELDEIIDDEMGLGIENHDE